VNALNQIGASVSYTNREGFPPLRIEPCKKENLTSEISISAQTSSQFISALMLVAPSLPNGLTIHLTGKIASRPYIEMTNKLLQKTGVISEFKEDLIKVQFHKFESQNIDLEADWSAASYFYAVAALSSKANVKLTNLNYDSSQGDAILVEWFSTYFGISSAFNENDVTLSSAPNFQLPSTINLDFSDYPDLAQTLAVLCACLGVRLIATGLESLLIKETNRINALSTELKKLGVTALTTTNSIEINDKIQSSKNSIEIKTYNDHRMAMSFSMVSLIRPITFDNEKVVSKSFPQFFSELEKLVSD
jgi:3-phosphoshikimate 1-carboxyvinyltransferase